MVLLKKADPAAGQHHGSPHEERSSGRGLQRGVYCSTCDSEAPSGIGMEEDDVQQPEPDQPKLQKKGGVLGIGERARAEEQKAGDRGKTKATGRNPCGWPRYGVQRTAAE